MREFSNNTNARLPVLFLLDTSSSMNGIIRGDNQHIVRQEYADGINWNIVTGDNMVTRMDELNTGLQRFVSDILADPLAKLADTVREMELDDIVLETDCPYLTPAPHRGERNESAYVRFVCEKVAELKGLPPGEVAAATTANAKRIFGI